MSDRVELGGIDWVEDGPRYVVVCFRGKLFRVRKPRVGLMRFGGEKVYGFPSGGAANTEDKR